MGTAIFGSNNWRRSGQKIMYIKAIIFVLFSLFLWLPVADGLTKHFKSNASILFTLVAYIFYYKSFPYSIYFLDSCARFKQPTLFGLLLSELSYTQS
jgi:hypothetical protein